MRQMINFRIKGNHTPTGTQSRSQAVSVHFLSIVVRTQGGAEPAVPGGSLVGPVIYGHLLTLITIKGEL